MPPRCITLLLYSSKLFYKLFKLRFQSRYSLCRLSLRCPHLGNLVLGLSAYLGDLLLNQR